MPGELIEQVEELLIAGDETAEHDAVGSKEVERPRRSYPGT
jgi:hypothetical protein